MEYIVLVLCVAISIVVPLLLRTPQGKPEDKTDTLAAMREEQRALREELSGTVQQSVRNFGDAVMQNQTLAADAQQRQLAALNQSMNEKQQLMQRTVTAQMRQLEERLGGLESNNEQKLEAMRATIRSQLDSIREDNTRKLDEMRVTVDQKLQKTLEEKLTNSFQSVSEQLAQVYQGLGEMQSIATGVGDLKKILSNVKTRGMLGEIQLGAILAEILAPEQYATDVATIPDSRNRVEFAVKLPGASPDSVLYLPIDSKFPGDTYAAVQDAYAAGDAEAIQAALAALETVLKKCARDICEKYVSPPYTTNFGILFLPFEGLYAEVVNRSLVEVLQRDYHVSVAGPSTMAALLNTLQMGFRTLQIQKRSSEVWQLLGAVKTEFDSFEKVFNSAKTRIRQLDEDMDKLIGVRTRAIQKQLRAVQSADPTQVERLLPEEEWAEP